MVIYGYAIEYQYAGDGTLMIKTRIPSIHGPMDMKEYKGNQVRNYTHTADLPFYPSVLLPHLPVEGDVVALLSLSHSNSEFLIVGITGGSYYKIPEQ